MLNSFHLHILAMGLMLCDHLWGTFLLPMDWLGYFGRLAFPIFAFMLVEGYFHSSDRKRYRRRMLLFGLISEIPFNLVMGSSLFYPLHQNVLFSFALGICMMNTMEKIRGKKHIALRFLLYFLTVMGFFLLGTVTFVDYYGYGILMIALFYCTYFSRDAAPWRRWLGMALQLLGMYWINCEMMKGLVLEFEVFGILLSFHKQGLALLALIPIWLYNGDHGPYNKTIRYLYYGFYPAHLLVLAVILQLL